MNRSTVWTHKNDIERPISLNAGLERVDRELTILRNLDLVTVLLQDLHSKLLVNQVVLGDQDIVRHVVLGHYRRHRI